MSIIRKKVMELEAMKWEGHWVETLDSQRLFSAKVRPGHVWAGVPGSIEAIAKWAGKREKTGLDIVLYERQKVDGPAADTVVLANVYDTLHSSWIRFCPGDWIVKGTKGEFYPVSESAFDDLYDIIDEAS